MYSSRGSNSYGQQEQSYPFQSAYTQNLLHGVSGTSVGRAERASQLSGASRHSSLLGGLREGDIGGYRGGHPHPSSGPHIGGQYSSAYGSAAQQVHQMSASGSMPSSLEGRSGFSSSLPNSQKFTSGDYTSLSSCGYGRKVEQLYTDGVFDYTPGDRHNCADRRSTYMGTDLPSETPARYAESVAFGNKHQPDIYDRTCQSSLLRQEQMLKKDSLQSASLDGSTRQTDLLPARVNSFHHLSQNQHLSQDATSYSGRIDPDPRSLSILGGSSYGGQQTSSILGAVPPRNVEDLLYVQGSSNPGYGVSLPPGRDYGAGKGLRSLSLDADYTNSMAMRGTRPMVNDYKDDRIAYKQELERSEKEHFRGYFHEREKDREWECERQRERERDRDRGWERERERERDQERVREGERERDRERQRIFERREKERERERKHVVEVKRDRTPARLSREHRGTLLTKGGRSGQRESPRAEAVHRRHSPERKRRDYICKVCSSSLVEVERDYLSLYKRYPRLCVSPECSKVVVNWPKGNMKLSLYTPVSFEHDFVEDHAASVQKELQLKLPTCEVLKSKHGNTVWNSKVILMSGLSKNALEELSSGISDVDRAPHFCNMLRFAVLRKNNSLMAIGGRWDPTDGGDPSHDDSSLVQTVTRYAKDVAHLDLENCKNWNRFLEVHYDRVGKDGIFSHKEVTVLYVPDISECLPSLESWRDQWLAHKKAINERERLESLRKQKSGEKKAGTKESGSEDIKHVKDPNGKLAEKNQELPSTGNPANAPDKEVLEIKTKENQAENDEKTIIADKRVETGCNELKKEYQEIVQTISGPVSGKKKIVKKIVRQKVAKKKLGVEIANKQENDLLNKKAVEEKMVDPEGATLHDGSSTNISAIKTFKRKKIVKKVIVGKVTEKEDDNVNSEVTSFNESECTETKSNCKSDGNSTVVIPHAGAKTSVKKKVIKRVPKTKAIAVDAKIGANNTGSKKDTKDECLVQDNSAVQIKEAQTSVYNIKESTEKSIEKNISNMKETEAVNAKKQDENMEKTAEGEIVSGFKMEIDNDKQKICQNDDHIKPIEREDLKDERESKGKDGRNDARDKFNKNLQQKKWIDEPPRHPGLILQTKGCKDSKLQSLSVSLDSLLDYNGKDIEESTFELSFFAESLYEMLQYEMGSRLLAFLQTLRIMLVSKRNHQKRQREDSSKKENEEKSSGKRPKVDGITDVLSTKMVFDEDTSPNNKKSTDKEDSTSLGLSEGVKMDETDPEEDPEEDEESPDVVLQHDSANEHSAQFGKMSVDEERGNDTINVKDKNKICERTIVLTPHLLEGSSDKVKKVEIKSQGKKGVDKELLQAFRFFDRNRVGYIRVEDMRLIIHNLGKCLSHGEVKELVLTALLESNTGRDDRILYDKLVKLSDI